MRVGFGHAVIQHAEELGLSDEQLGRVTRIQRETQGERTEAMRNLMRNMHVLHRALIDPGATEDDIRRLTAEHDQAKQAWVRTMLDERNAVMEELTSGQRSKLRELEMGEKHRHGH